MNVSVFILEILTARNTPLIARVVEISIDNVLLQGDMQIGIGLSLVSYMILLQQMVPTRYGYIASSLIG